MAALLFVMPPKPPFDFAGNQSAFVIKLKEAAKLDTLTPSQGCSPSSPRSHPRRRGSPPVKGKSQRAGFSCFRYKSSGQEPASLRSTFGQNAGLVRREDDVLEVV